MAKVTEQDLQTFTDALREFCKMTGNYEEPHGINTDGDCAECDEMPSNRQDDEIRRLESENHELKGRQMDAGQTIVRQQQRIDDLNVNLRHKNEKIGELTGKNAELDGLNRRQGIELQMCWDQLSRIRKIAEGTRVENGSDENVRKVPHFGA